MDKLRIIGGKPLHGTVAISGAKNAALPLMTACLLSDKPLTLANLPHLADITTLATLLGHHGVRLTMEGHAEGGHTGHVMTLDASGVDNLTAPYELVRKMRASVLVLGPLLARFGEAIVSLPGGCAIGTRPIDLHLKAMQELGATITLDQGYVHAKVDGRLKGAEIQFDKVSVGATENALMAATLAKGRTILRNAAREPEITDLAHCLQAMGARIEGVGTDRLVIDGVERLQAARHAVVADRIEAGSFAVAAAITGGDVVLQGVQPQLMRAVMDKLRHAGVGVEDVDGGIRVYRDGTVPLLAQDMETQPFPGFPTDMQAQWMALMTIAEGASAIDETIFENRFMHVPELGRMGANITLKGHTAIVRGVEKLRGAPVMATDLRASISLVLAALAAEGETEISRIYHLDRGYERVEEKLSNLGASIARVAG